LWSTDERNGSAGHELKKKFSWSRSLYGAMLRSLNEESNLERDFDTGSVSDACLW
jgi:hypothetical protein